MASPKKPPETQSPPRSGSAILVQPVSPRYPLPPSPTRSPLSHRRIGIAVDLSDESAHAVRWAVHNYLRHNDAVTLLHVRPTSVLYGADWGPLDGADDDDTRSRQELEDDFDAFTASKSSDLARPLADSGIPYRIHIVKDHDMKERLCLEVERLGLSAVILGSRGFGASRRERERGDRSLLGSVSDYCVRHCVCPVVVVRYPDENEQGGGGGGGDGAVRVVAEEETKFHDASDKQTELKKAS